MVPGEVQAFLGEYGRIVQIELPLVDLTQYARINRALARTQKEPLARLAQKYAGKRPAVGDVLQLAEERREAKELRDRILAQISQKSAKPAELRMNATRLAQLLSKEGESADLEETTHLVDAITTLSEIANSRGEVSQLRGKVETYITSYVDIKDNEIAMCIRNLPTKEQLAGKKAIVPRDDIDLNEPEVKVETKKVKSNDLFEFIRVPAGEEYLRKNRADLAELYEIMTEKEVRDMLYAGMYSFVLTLSAEDAAQKILANFRTWKKRNVGPSGEEGYRKEKELVSMLVEAEKRKSDLSRCYKNYYESLFDEVASVDPSALDPNKGIDLFEELRNVVRAKATGSATTGFFKLAQPDVSLSIEEIDKAEREYRRKRLRHKGYCMVTFSTTVSSD